MHEEDELDDTRMTLGEHLEELRWRIIRALVGLMVAMVVCLIFGKVLIGIIKEPYDVVMNGVWAKKQGIKPDLVVLTPTEALTTYLRVAFIGGLLLASPWVFYQLWMFVSAGLYRHERRYVYFAVPSSAGLFVCGAVFFLKVISIPVLGFLLRFAGWMDLRPVIKLQAHIAFMTQMMLVFGICFQTPLFVLMLVKLGIVSIRTLCHYRRHVIVAILIIAAFLTSPSPVDQVGLAVPMYLLYELGILLGWLSIRKQERPPEEE